MSQIYLHNVVLKKGPHLYCRADLSLDLGVIAAIDVLEEGPFAYLAADYYLTAGFVNAHIHPNLLFDRRRLDALPITELLHKMHFADPKKTDEDRYTQALFVLLDAVKSGATTLYSVANAPLPVLRAYRDLKLKGAVTCFYNDQWEGHGDPPTLQELHAVEAHFAQAHALAVAGVGVHIGSASVESASNELLRLMNQLALRYDSKVNIHVSEGMESVASCTRSRHFSPIRLLDHLGVLNSHWNLIHAVSIDAEEIDIIAKSGASVIHCPVSNAKTAVGLAPIKELLAKGVRVALGSDACSNNNTNNVVNEAYVAALIHSLFHNDPTVLTVDKLFEMLIPLGHQVVGSSDRGEILVGAPADLLLWDLRAHAFVPLTHGNLDAAILYNAPDLKPHTIFLSGEKVVENYQLLLRCEHALRRAANASAEKLFFQGVP